MFFPVFLAISSALFAPAQAPKSTRPFSAALDHGQKGAAEWIAELEKSQLASTDALWSLYYLDERSPAVIDALARCVSHSSDRLARRAADTILIAWRIPHDFAPLDVYVQTGQPVLPDAVFPTPLPTVTGDEDELVRALHADDVRAALSAAEALIASGRRADEALAEIILLVRGFQGRAVESEDPVVLTLATRVQRWAREFAGSAFGSAVGVQLESEQDDAERARAWFDLLGEDERSASGALAAVGRLCKRTDAVGDRARARTKSLFHPFLQGSESNEEWWLHAAWRYHEERDPFVDGAAAEYVATELAQDLSRGTASAASLERVHAAIIRNRALAERTTPTLRDLVLRDDATGLVALRILSHIDDASDIVRERYLAVVRNWKFTAENAGRVPCRKHHDAETLAAFAELFQRAPAKDEFQEQLEFAGLTDASKSPLARAFLDSIDRHEGGWAWLEENGWRGLVEVDTTAERAVQVNEIALNIATKRDLGVDYAQDEAKLVAILDLPYDQRGAEGYSDQVEWGFHHARRLGLHSPGIVRAALHYIDIGGFPNGFDTHVDSARAFLENAQLTLEEQVEVAHRLPPEANSGWTGLNLDYAAHGGVPRGGLALERAPALRATIYAGDVHALEHLLRITAMSSRDEEYWLATVDRGPADARKWALDLAHEYGLETSRVRDAFKRHAQSDLDRNVRERAREVVTVRGW